MEDKNKLIIRFLLKLALALALFQIPFLIEAFLPKDTFSGPALAKRYTSIYGTYFPNSTFTIKGKGNLAYGTNLGKYKQETQIIDNLGFRNDTIIPNPDLVLIGDSQIACLSVSQESILANQIMDSVKIKVYNVAIGDVQTFFQLISDSVIQKPKMVIFEKVEREIPDFKLNTFIRKGQLASILKEVAVDPQYQAITNFLSKYTRNHITKSLRAEVFGRRALYPQSVLDKNMFFNDGNSKMDWYDLTEEEMDDLVNEFLKTKQWFDEEGIEFAFMPFPNKETIYWEHVPFTSQPDFLPKLVAKMEHKGIQVIPTLELFSNHPKNDYLYHTDDTHWNEKGIKKVSELIIKHFYQNQ